MSESILKDVDLGFPSTQIPIIKEEVKEKPKINIVIPTIESEPEAPVVIKVNLRLEKGEEPPLPIVEKETISLPKCDCNKVKSSKHSPRTDSILDDIDTGFGEDNKTNLDHCTTPGTINFKTPLTKENYLSEFTTEAEKEKVRENLGITCTGGSNTDTTNHTIVNPDGAVKENTELVKVLVGNKYVYLKTYDVVTDSVTYVYDKKTRLLTLSCKDSKANIYYYKGTANGYIGILYTGPISVTNGIYNFYAKSIAANSPISSVTINDTVDAPIIVVGGNEFDLTRTVTIESLLEGVTLSYYDDKSKTWIVKSSIQLAPDSYHEYKIKVKAHKDGYNDYITTKTVIVKKPRYYWGTTPKKLMNDENLNSEISALISNMEDGKTLVSGDKITDIISKTDTSYFWFLYPNDKENGGIALKAFKDLNNFTYELNESYIELTNSYIINGNTFTFIRWIDYQHWDNRDCLIIQT